MNRKSLSDGVIELRLKKVYRGLFFPLSYNYDIHKCDSGEMVGRCDYRVQKNRENYYGGNIGYMIFPEYRGSHYALAAAKLLLQTVPKHNRELIITCSPENIASYKTIIELGGQFIEEVAVPEDHYLYIQGEKIKNIFKIDLRKLQPETANSTDKAGADGV